jgi:hypothetical protein
MWAKLLYFLEAFFLFFAQFFERWLLALTGVAGLAGGAVACLLFILSSGYFFPELRQKSRTLFLAAGFVSLLGGTLLFNEIGRWIGVSSQVSKEYLNESSNPTADPLFEAPLGGGSGSVPAAGTVVVPPEVPEQPSAPPATFPIYVALAASDGSWPALWSDVSSSAYALLNVPAGAEVQLTGDCVADTASNYWCPVTYDSQSGWIASGNLVAK